MEGTYCFTKLLFGAPETFVKNDGLENIYNFTFEYFFIQTYE